MMLSREFSGASYASTAFTQHHLGMDASSTLILFSFFIFFCRSTFGSSASDMLLMPIYFSALQAIVYSKAMRKMFPGRCIKNDEGDCSIPDTHEESRFDDIYTHFCKKSLRRARLLISVLTLPAVWAIVKFSDVCGSRVRIPGIGIALNSMLSCVIPTAYPLIYRLFQSKKDTVNLRSLLVAEVRKVTTQMSDICYYMVLAVIGVSTNLGRQIFDGGWAESSSFLFASTSLFTHLVTIIFGSYGAMHFFPRIKQFPLGVEEIAVASCAAISGPQAAASFAVKTYLEKRGTSLATPVNWRGLILSGTVLGVLGYIISCPVGVSLSKVLLYSIQKWHWYT
jgi:hypothetical protein